MLWSDDEKRAAGVQPRDRGIVRQLVVRQLVAACNTSSCAGTGEARRKQLLTWHGLKGYSEVAWPAALAHAMLPEFRCLKYYRTSKGAQGGARRHEVILWSDLPRRCLL